MRIHPRRIFDLAAKIPGLLQRRTSSGWFLPQIDGLRFVAIATVLIVHIIAYTIGTSAASDSSSWLVSNYEHLAHGVELFFVISGFVIAMPFAIRAQENKPSGSLKDFYVRRLMRLEPPFLIAMVLTYASLVLVHHSSARGLLPHLLATCTYTHAMIYGSKSPIAFITWSLEIEIQFYLLAPLIMSVFRQPSWIRRAALAALAITSLGVQGLIVHSHPVLGFSLIAYLSFFVAGIIACDLAIENSFWGERRALQWDAIGVVAIIGAYSLPSSGFLASAVMSLLFGTAVIAAFRGAALAQVMALPWLTAVGGMCYTIYLLHVPLIYLFGRVVRLISLGRALELNAGIQVLLLPLPILLVCSLYFLAVEKPCMNKHWPRDLARLIWAAPREQEPQISTNPPVAKHPAPYEWQSTRSEYNAQ